MTLFFPSPFWAYTLDKQGKLFMETVHAMRNFSETEQELSGIEKRKKNLIRGRVPGAINKINRLKELHASHGEEADPKTFLLSLMLDSEQETDLRLRAATALLPFYHSKKAMVVEATLQQKPERVSHELVIRMAQALLLETAEDGVTAGSND